MGCARVRRSPANASLVVLRHTPRGVLPLSLCSPLSRALRSAVSCRRCAVNAAGRSLQLRGVVALRACRQCGSPTTPAPTAATATTGHSYSAKLAVPSGGQHVHHCLCSRDVCWCSLNFTRGCLSHHGQRLWLGVRAADCSSRSFANTGRWSLGVVRWQAPERHDNEPL